MRAFSGNHGGCHTQDSFCITSAYMLPGRWCVRCEVSPSRIPSLWTKQISWRQILEAPFAHVLALVLVLTEPRENEITNTCPDTLKEALEIRSCRLAMSLAPWLRVPLHMEDVTDVSDPGQG